MTNETIAKEVAEEVYHEIFGGTNYSGEAFEAVEKIILEALARSQSSEWIPVETRLRELLDMVFDRKISPGKAEEAIHDLAAGKSIVLPSAPKETR